MRIEVDPWDVVGEWTENHLKPMLQDDEVTVERYYKRFRDKFATREAARTELDKMHSRGLLVKDKRRTGHGGSLVTVYILPEGKA